MYEPKLGDYGVVRTNGFSARCIQIGTLSKWNHAVIYIGNNLIVEANPAGVQISSADKYSVIVWNQHEDLTNEERKNIVKWALSQVGESYSFLTIALIVFRTLGFKVLVGKLAIKLAQKEGYICSELVAECYSKTGHPLCSKPDWQIVPGDLAERLLWQ
jgi:uncharacterized protein YycO